jgi:hypothetical protein
LKSSPRKQEKRSKKGQKEAELSRTEEETRELIMVGSYLTHNPSNVACMQIKKSNNSKRPKTSISH